jgi:hypothetical protein
VPGADDCDARIATVNTVYGLIDQLASPLTFADPVGSAEGPLTPDGADSAAWLWTVRPYVVLIGTKARPDRRKRR